MGKKIILENGTRFNNLIVLKEVQIHIQPNGKKVRQFLCKCKCGKIKSIRLEVLRGGIKSCGCKYNRNIKVNNKLIIIIMNFKNCVICGDMFLKKISNQQICGKECRKELRKQQSKKSRDKIENKYHKKIWSAKYYQKNKEIIKENVSRWNPYEHLCRECGITFNDGRKNSKFCSITCAGIQSKRTRLGANNPAFRNGFYTKESKKTNIRNNKQNEFIKVCKELDMQLINNKGYIYCEECYTTNTLKFEHHHIVYRSEKPKHEYLHNINNILLLCIKCHNEFHKHKSKRNQIVEKRELNILFGNDILNK